jgi:hypothetical protein
VWAVVVEVGTPCGDEVYGHDAGCQSQSLSSAVGSVPAGSPSALWYPRHACARRVYILLTLLRGRSDAVFSPSRALLRDTLPGNGSSAGLPASAICANDDSQTAAFRRQFLQQPSQLGIGWAV